jgi:hypothetical protein
MGEKLGSVSDLAELSDRIARRAWRARAHGTGMYLSPEEVVALHEMEGDGEWWQSFNPAHPNNRKDQNR